MDLERLYREKGEGGIGDLWVLPSRRKLGLGVALGVLVGIALMSLPALISPASQASNTGGANSLTAGEARSPGTAGETTSPAPNVLGLVLGLSLIYVPTTVVSFTVRRWAARKLVEY